jgi:hypothetical protein
LRQLSDLLIALDKASELDLPDAAFLEFNEHRTRILLAFHGQLKRSITLRTNVSNRVPEW